jgi:antitoxin FitA
MGARWEEKKAREILRQAVGSARSPKNLGKAIHARFTTIGGVGLARPAR